ncbi:hypothetical protein Metfor_1925 [Methanoregula formicica SMSP]|uniref:Uncharacterized protein n=1 Tax=Methanoregula formicica (strain DSM 22288 / NBRC 105244 / SMSP) TaxID=593750 RepID=L0HHZ3_METFS|nr:hypothetical protein Metfor_1925 [Methanoregula formicica SMSP]
MSNVFKRETREDEVFEIREVIKPRDGEDEVFEIREVIKPRDGEDEVFEIREVIKPRDGEDEVFEIREVIKPRDGEDEVFESWLPGMEKRGIRPPYVPGLNTPTENPPDDLVLDTPHFPRAAISRSRLLRASSNECSHCENFRTHSSSFLIFASDSSRKTGYDVLCPVSFFQENRP